MSCVGWVEGQRHPVLKEGQAQADELGDHRSNDACHPVQRGAEGRFSQARQFAQPFGGRGQRLYVSPTSTGRHWNERRGPNLLRQRPPDLTR